MDELCQNYASALFSLLSPKEREEVDVALKSILDDLSRDQEFAKFLSSYNFSKTEKQQAIDAVYGKKFAQIPHLISFIKVVIDNHRIQELPKIYVAYRSLLHEAMGVKEGIAYSAVRLKEDELHALEKGIGKRLGVAVSLTNIVDHKLLGGVKVSIDGKVFDGTLASKLAGLKHTLKGGVQ